MAAIRPRHLASGRGDGRRGAIWHLLLSSRPEHASMLPMLATIYIYAQPPMKSSVCPTVCVTRAGAGGGKPSDWKNDKA